MIAMRHAKTVYTMEIGTCYETTFFFPPEEPVYQPVALCNSQGRICLVSGNLVSANNIIESVHLM